jgi:hypothetical protein
MALLKPHAEKPRPNHARRVKLRYDGNSWSLISVSKTPPTILPTSESLGLESASGKAGAWYELADQRGRLVYRQLIYNLYGQVGEGYEKGRQIGRIREVRETVVSLLIPNLPEGGRFHLYSSPPLSRKGAEKVVAGAKRVVSFDLPPDEKEEQK